MSKTIDEIIQEAMQRGEFDNLSGEGKPLDLSEYFNTPEDVRLTYSILKNANIVPEEASLLKEVAELKQTLAVIGDEPRKAALRRKIEDRLLHYNLLMERYRKSK